ncbi:MAG: hypothetical protein HY874_02530 [Chloroflexi bacterium]|nr:hypothetical protein [Chloroflexota bacterium]
MTEEGKQSSIRYGRIDKAMMARWLQLSPEDDGPFWAVNLMKYRDVADYADGRTAVRSGREADDEYTPVASLAAIGAQVVFSADVDTQLLGRAPVWDRVGVVRYPSRRKFFEMQQRDDFKAKHVHKDAGMEQTIVMSCLPMATPALPADAPKLTDVPHPATSDDGPVVVIHVLRFVEGHGIGEMTSYTEAAGQVALPHGVRLSGWFSVEGTIVGDGRSWDQVRFNAFPSRAAFMAVVKDPERLRAQREHRETAIADTYTMILRPAIDRLADSVSA